MTCPRNNEECVISFCHRNRSRAHEDIVFFTKYSYLPKEEVFLFEL